MDDAGNAGENRLVDLEDITPQTSGGSYREVSIIDDPVVVPGDPDLRATFDEHFDFYYYRPVLRLKREDSISLEDFRIYKEQLLFSTPGDALFCVSAEFGQLVGLNVQDAAVVVK